MPVPLSFPLMKRFALYVTAVTCTALLAGCQTTGSRSQPVETFRNATGADLSLGILSVTRDAAGFPLPVANLRSLTEDEIIVTYGPGDLTIHCGPYVSTGPTATYDIRREILDSYGYMDFPPNTSGWAELSADGKLQLLHPTRLAPGQYELWATLRVPDCGILHTPHQAYIVTIQKPTSRDK